jgi:hypothetical protein
LSVGEEWLFLVSLAKVYLAVLFLFGFCGGRQLPPVRQY